MHKHRMWAHSPNQGDSPTERIVERLRIHGCNPTRTGPAQYKARCPCGERHKHHDRKKSLAVGVGDDGSAVVHCFRGCQTLEVLVRLGLEKRDLYPRTERRRPLTERTRGPRRFFPTVEDAARYSEATVGGSYRCHWHYHDRAGVEVFAVARYEWPDGSKGIRPFTKSPKGWRIGAPKGRRPLYGLPLLAGASRVVVCEGEKTTEAARRIGLTATTSSFGAQAAGRSNWRPLAGVEVIIVPDADDSGELYAAEVREILRHLRPRPDIHIVRLPGLEPGEDFHDWTTNHLPDSWEQEQCRAEFERIVSEAIAAERREIARPTLRLTQPPMEPTAKPRSGHADSKLLQCAEWLARRLVAGQVPSTVIQAEARQQGFGRWCLSEAKRIIGAESVQSQFRRGWFYQFTDRGREASPNSITPPTPLRAFPQ